MPTEKEIVEVIERFESFMADDAKKEPAWRVRCRICNHPNRRAINRGMLAHTMTDREIAREVGVTPPSARYHRLTCLPNRGGAELTDVERMERHRLRLYPAQGEPPAQKLWYLKELLFLRDEALKKTTPDRKELLRLAEKIAEAADDLQAARAAARAKGKKTDDPEEDLELPPEAREQMNHIDKKPGGELGQGN